MKNFSIIVLILSSITFAQSSAHLSLDLVDVLFDDVNSCHPLDIWVWLLDTLENHGATIHLVSDEGWFHLDDIEMIWIECPMSNYSPAVKSALFDFARNGGKIVMGDVQDPTPLNDLLTDDGWTTTMHIVDTHLPEHIEYFYPFPPFTDGVDYIELSWPRMIHCGHNAYPFAFADMYYSQPVAAVSYPFKDEENCSSFVVLVMGTHSWETYSSIIASNYRFASNILLCAAGLPGFEIEGCDSPDVIHAEAPECADPGDIVRLTGSGLCPDITVHIGDTEITPAGYASDSTWLDFICPSMPQGIYTLRIEKDGIYFYVAEFQIYCEWIDFASFTEGCYEIGDTVYFTGENFSPGNMSIDIRCPFDTTDVLSFDVVSEDSGWFVIPDDLDTADCSYFSVCITNTVLGNYDCHFLRVPCLCPGTDSLFRQDVFEQKPGDTRPPQVFISPIDTCVYIGSQFDILWTTSDDSFMATPLWPTREPMNPMDITIEWLDDSITFSQMPNSGVYPWVAGDYEEFLVIIGATDWFGNSGADTIVICTKEDTSKIDGYVLSPPCNPDSVVFIVHHTQPIDTTAITLMCDGKLYVYPDSMYFLNDTTLIFYLPEGSNGSHYIELGRLCDTTGQCMEEISTGFTLDLDPPIIISLLDTNIAPEGTTLTIRYVVVDSFAGLDWDNFSITVDDSAVPYLNFGDTVEITLDSVAIGTLAVCVDAQDFPFPPCPPNTARLCDNIYIYQVIPDYGCQRMPNPFTPNADSKNDFCQFFFPQLGRKEGIISIYDIYGHKVRRIKVPSGRDAKEVAKWYGKNDDGQFLPEGLYLYVIEVENEVVCDGTVVIAR